MKVYTKKGDSGTTSTYGMGRCNKDDELCNTLGNVDELNSFIGVSVAWGNAVSPDDEHASSIVSFLKNVQQELIYVGSCIGSPLSPDAPEPRSSRVPQITADHVMTVEKTIDDWTELLAPLRTFILPGGNHFAASLHVCRTVCRRAERTIVTLVRNGRLENVILQYMNRLSDMFFTAARLASVYEETRSVPQHIVSSTV